MNGIGAIPQSLQTLTPSYAPLGKTAAGLESPENKDQTLPPVEEANAGEKNRHQPDHRAAPVSANAGGHGGQHSQRDSDGTGSAPPEAPVESASLILAPEQQASDVSELAVALQRVATLHGDNHKSVGGAQVVDSFSAAAGHILTPGLLLDQQS